MPLNALLPALRRLHAADLAAKTAAFGASTPVRVCSQLLEKLPAALLTHPSLPSDALELSTLSNGHCIATTCPSGPPIRLRRPKLHAFAMVFSSDGAAFARRGRRPYETVKRKA